ncbi:MAG: transposase [Mycobacterium sp.]|nr:transposase [Mycobacterium sp.]
MRAKVEHPFLIVKRDFGFSKTRYRGIAKNLNHLQMLFASANWLMRAPTSWRGDGQARACPKPAPPAPGPGAPAR